MLVAVTAPLYWLDIPFLAESFIDVCNTITLLTILYNQFLIHFGIICWNIWLLYCYDDVY